MNRKLTKNQRMETRKINAAEGILARSYRDLKEIETEARKALEGRDYTKIAELYDEAQNHLIADDIVWKRYETLSRGKETVLNEKLRSVTHNIQGIYETSQNIDLAKELIMEDERENLSEAQLKASQKYEATEEGQGYEISTEIEVDKMEESYIEDPQKNLESLFIIRGNRIAKINNSARNRFLKNFSTERLTKMKDNLARRVANEERKGIDFAYLNSRTSPNYEKMINLEYKLKNRISEEIGLRK
jgi:hypothetical protein